jgi:hypothetical protein
MDGNGEARGDHDIAVIAESGDGSAPASPDSAARTAAIRRAVVRLCLALGWSPLHEVRLPNGRRADILALRQDGSFACVEVKSGARDFMADTKWAEYRPYCDALLFAVDADFPLALLPAGTGLIVAGDGVAELLRAAPEHRMPPARRRALAHRFAQLAALRLVALQDPAALAESRAGLLVE